MQEKKKKNASHQFEQKVMVNNFNRAENELEAICCTDFFGGGFGKHLVIHLPLPSEVG